MNKLILAGILLLITTSLIGQDYKPYTQTKDGDYDEQGNNFKKFKDENSADGFFDNYVNGYEGDPNAASMKKNKEIRLQQEKLLKEKEAILNSLDSLSIASQKEELKISDLKAKVAKENAIKGNRQGSSYNNTNNYVPSQQNNRSLQNKSPQQNDNYDVLYEYERKVVRRPN